MVLELNLHKKISSVNEKNTLPTGFKLSEVNGFILTLVVFHILLLLLFLLLPAPASTPGHVHVHRLPPATWLSPLLGGASLMDAGQIFRN